jgi:hypothetical protein
MPFGLGEPCVHLKELWIEDLGIPDTCENIVVRLAVATLMTVYFQKSVMRGIVHTQDELTGQLRT